MDKMRGFLDGVMTEQDSGPSALTAVGLNSGNAFDLLEDALENGIGPQPQEAEQEKPRRRADFDQLNHDMKDVLRGTPAAEGSNEPEPDEEPDGEPEEAKKADELPSYFHSLNSQQQSILEDNQRLARQMEESQRQSQWLMQQLARQNQPAPPQDTLYENLGVDPEAYHALRNQVRHEQAQQIQQAMAPVMHAMARNQFQLAVQEAGGKFEHFNKYYPQEVLGKMFDTVVQSKGLGVALQVNWGNEFAQAYRAADYERLSKEYAAMKANPQPTQQDKAKEQKAEKKANLKLVPPANKQGAPSRASLAKDIDNLPSNLSFKAYGSELLKRLYGNS